MYAVTLIARSTGPMRFRGLMFARSLLHLLDEEAASHEADA